jgi:hypothetical protein
MYPSKIGAHQVAHHLPVGIRLASIGVSEHPPLFVAFAFYLQT